MSSKSRYQQQQQQQQYKTGGGRQSHHTPISRQQQNLEHQIELEQRATIKASFGTDATQLKWTIYLVVAIASVLIGIAFFSHNWLEVERRFHGPKFKQLGLWRVCFNSFSSPDDFYFQKFYVGCRFIFADEYKPIRNFLLPAFFIATQVLFTIGFLLLILVGVGIIAIQQCFVIDNEVIALRALSIVSLLSAISCTLAVTIFATNATRYDWMPDPEHNYLSWSFAAALIGSVFLWIAALLFYIEMRLTIVRESRRDSYSRS